MAQIAHGTGRVNHCRQFATVLALRGAGSEGSPSPPSRSIRRRGNRTNSNINQFGCSSRISGLKIVYIREFQPIHWVVATAVRSSCFGLVKSQIDRPRELRYAPLRPQNARAQR
jgi:hypothetical protein